MDPARLYGKMCVAREFEQAVGRLWQEGRITGEMHASTGEEAVAAGVVAHLEEQDALALTHRCTAFALARGVPMVPFLREMLGRRGGLSDGRAGHMHVFSRRHRVVSSGIVGASLPAGAGFALSAKRQRPGAIAVAQTGDGAMNQGMVLETLNLAVAWNLPLLVVCIDNDWAIATPAGTVTGGDLDARARAFGWTVERVDGTDPAAVYEVAGRLVHGLRRGQAPAFLLATCPRMDGHYLGDPLVRTARDLTGEGRGLVGAVMGGALSSGGGLLSRAAGVGSMMGVLKRARGVPRPGQSKDPLVMTRKRLKRSGVDVDGIERDARMRVEEAVGTALEDGDDRS